MLCVKKLKNPCLLLEATAKITQQKLIAIIFGEQIITHNCSSFFADQTQQTIIN